MRGQQVHEKTGADCSPLYNRRRVYYKEETEQYKQRKIEKYINNSKRKNFKGEKNSTSKS